MMPKLSLLIALSACACCAVAATRDKAGNRIETLPPLVDTTGTAQTWTCTHDGLWCASVEQDGRLHVKSSNTETTSGAVTWSDADGDHAAFRLWPKAIRLADGGAILGVLREISTSYSGGGAEASELQLFEMDHGQAKAIVRLPASGNASIRACFSDEDVAHRAGACEDDYNFTSELDLDDKTVQGPPVLRLTTAATSFPGHVSRSEDSLAAPPLHEKDLVTVTDARCTYQRRFHRDAATSRYLPDAALPSCSDYTSP